MAQFSIHGPFEVPFTTARNGRYVSKDVQRKFWDKDGVKGLNDSRGIYVFVVGKVPYCVGMTKRCFQDECFQHHKRTKYKEALAEGPRQRPRMFLIALDTDGRPSSNEIKDLETQLIQSAFLVNPNLRNDRKIRKSAWSIKGLEGHRGRPTTTVTRFKSVMGL